MTHTTGNTRRHLLRSSLIAAPALLLLKASPGWAAGVAADGKEVIAETTSGRIRGVMTPDGVRTFKGVPYAASPTGRNRFMPPVRPAPWGGVRDAIAWGNRCPQIPSASSPETLIYLGNIDGTPGAQDEDCLVVNVWTKGVRDGGKRPVMLRIHGGGFTTGTGNNQKYWGHNTARRGDVVYVSVNHRLGALGYLDLSQIGGPEYAKSGNVGMLDLVASLEWIRDNIEAFGGDPNNVTIWGESGGGFKVSVLMAMPAAKGLFHRAVVESGPGLTVKPKAQATQLAERFLTRMKLDRSRLRELHDLPAYRLLEGQMMSTSRRWYPADPPIPGGFSPVLDAVVIPQNPFEPTAPAISANVPMIVGYNRDEGTYLLQNDPDLYALDEAGLQKRLQARVGASAERLLAAYRRDYPGATPTQIMGNVARDMSFGTGSVLMAERKAALQRAPAYMYRFDWQSPTFNGLYGATHGSEDAFFMDNIDTQKNLTHQLPQARELAAKINAVFIGFARTGIPGAAGMPKWPAYDSATRATMVFDNQSRVENDPAPEVRKLWKDIRPETAVG